jgi:ketosteroid isomerase-like protein
VVDSVDVQQLADDLEIRNLVATLAHLADMAPAEDLDYYLSLYTEDARWAMPGSAFQGRDKIRDGALGRRAQGVQGPGTNTRHVITTHSVAVDGDTAEGQAYFMMVADTLTAPQIRGIGHYRDSYRRTPEGWKLASREISLG